jgi:hypothetical protein
VSPETAAAVESVTVTMTVDVPGGAVDIWKGLAVTTTLRAGAVCAIEVKPLLADWASMAPTVQEPGAAEAT